MTMAHPSVDLVEEDAADLQFPKAIISAKSPKFSDKASLEISKRPKLQCHSCTGNLCEPFVKCLECPDTFCAPCFASGAETPHHGNYHSYTICQDNFPIFPTSTWTGKEEKLLLDLISKYGLGNWNDIGKFMGKYSSRECQRHYSQFYLQGFVGRMSGIDIEPYEREFRPYWAKTESTRLFRFHPETLHAKALAGYRAARGEFDIPYDQTAESILSGVDIDPWPNKEDSVAAETLNCSIFKVFNHRLRERHRRYRVIREHGLLDHQSSAARLRSIGEILSVGNTSIAKANNPLRFSAFMQLLSAEEFDLLLIRLKHSQDIRCYLQKLQELRRLGITSIHGGKLYHKLLAARQLRMKQQKKEMESLEVSESVSPQTRKVNPIDIVGLSGYDKLSDDEKHICSTLRFEPNTFFAHRETLVAANAKNGHLILGEARKLLKIDVNKTRKLYDFLLSRGLINKPDN